MKIYNKNLLVIVVSHGLESFALMWYVQVRYAKPRCNARLTDRQIRVMVKKSINNFINIYFKSPYTIVNKLDLYMCNIETKMDSLYDFQDLLETVREKTDYIRSYIDTRRKHLTTILKYFKRAIKQQIFNIATHLFQCKRTK